MLERLGVSHMAEENVNWHKHFEIQVTVSPKVKHTPHT